MSLFIISRVVDKKEERNNLRVDTIDFQFYCKKILDYDPLFQRAGIFLF